MAPEVIKSMGVNSYDGRSDIWSLGITCIELAERKPPHFNMHSMAALYHIAQSEPPELAYQTQTHGTPDGQTQTPTYSTDPYTGEFRDFVRHCLRKEPIERPTAPQCLEAPFVRRARPPRLVFELIQRSKERVEQLDSERSRRMRDKFAASGMPLPAAAAQAAQQQFGTGGRPRPVHLSSIAAEDPTVLMASAAPGGPSGGLASVMEEDTTPTARATGAKNFDDHLNLYENLNFYENVNFPGRVPQQQQQQNPSTAHPAPPPVGGPPPYAPYGAAQMPMPMQTDDPRMYRAPHHHHHHRHNHHHPHAHKQQQLLPNSTVLKSSPESDDIAAAQRLPSNSSNQSPSALSGRRPGHSSLSPKSDDEDIYPGDESPVSYQSCTCFDETL